MDDIKKDERFSHIFTDPQFRRIPKNVRKIKVDKRFKDLLKNKKFSEKCRVNERGRALNLGSFENLSKIYNLEEESESDASSDENNDLIVEKKKSTKSREKSKKKSKTKKLQVENQSLNESEEVTETSSPLKMSKKLKKINKLRKKDSEDNSNFKLLKADKNLQKDKSLLTCRFQENFLSKDDSEESNNTSSLNKCIDTKITDKKDTNNVIKLKSSKSKKCLEKLEKNKNLVSDVRFNADIESEDGSSEDESNEKYNGKKSDEESISEEDSDTDSESDDSDNKGDEFDHEWEEQHEKAPDTDEITRRLAVCNMDWDRIRAVDLFVVFNSFKPPDTTIVSVKIYPSEYGLQRMEEEKLKGPLELVEKTLGPNEEEVKDKKGGRYHREKLRQYQMNRLKYYYAIVECDTPETANTLYEQLIGMEYESSSVRFDLRFVPDDTTFDREPTSVANDPDLSEYRPKLFVTSALQQVKVGLTWDETDPQRREILQKAFTDPDDFEKNIKEYLASSSGESDEENDEDGDKITKLSFKERIQKYKDLLASLDEQNKEKNEDKYDMEITWQSGAKEETENLVKEKLEEKTFTPFEESQKKRKEKLKLKKREKKAKNRELQESGNEQSDDSVSDSSMELKRCKSKEKISMSDDELNLVSNAEISEVGDKHILKKKKKEEKRKKKNDNFQDELYLISDAKKPDVDEKHISKKKKKKEEKQKKKNDDFQVDVNDPRFSAIYTSPLFNIDPSDPHFKPTPGNMAIIAEKQRRIKNKNLSNEEVRSSKKFKYG